MLSISQACQNYLRIIQCLTVFTPCTGTAWCGSMSPTELTTALSNACGCTGTSCTFTVPTVANYYQGSSSGGRVSNNMLTCQDVSHGKECWYKQHLCACIPLFVLCTNIAYLNGLLSVIVVQPLHEQTQWRHCVYTRCTVRCYKVTYNIPSIIASHAVQGVIHSARVYSCAHQEVCCHIIFCIFCIFCIFLHGYHFLNLPMLAIVPCISIDV